MTREDILVMEPGRELDALVAERVMGWTGIWTNGKSYMAYHPCEQEMSVGEAERSPIWPYSTDIASAWGVVEKMAARMNNYPVDGFKWSGPLYKPNTHYLTSEGYPLGTVCWYVLVQNDNIGRHIVCADTSPEAICKAALLATLGGD